MKSKFVGEPTVILLNFQVPDELPLANKVFKLNTVPLLFVGSKLHWVGLIFLSILGGFNIVTFNELLARHPAIGGLFKVKVNLNIPA